MSEEERIHRKTRVWLYAIALLHLVYLALLHRPAPEPVHAVTHYARHAVTTAAAPRA